MNVLARACFHIAAVLVAGSASADVGPALDVVISPIIEMQGDNIIACGQRARFEPSHADVDLALRKDEARAILTLTAHVDGERLQTISLKTASISSADIFGPTTTLPGGGAQRVATPVSDKATVFLREYFVSGFALRLDAKGGKTIELRFDGPSPNSVRAAYLNCAGDFFR